MSFEAKSIASAVTICTNQKRVRATDGATPSALRNSPLPDLAAQWRSTIDALPAWGVSRSLYAGRAFGLVRDISAAHAGRMFVVSAGLGLVDDETALPAYGLTVSSNHPESIADKALGPFDASAWFDHLLQGPYSVAWDAVFRPRGGRVLLALSRPYAMMIGPSLAGLPAGDRSRLRIFGAGISQSLPEQIASCVLPYDARLDALLPGTKSDFAQRALVHFVRHVAEGPGNWERDARAVREALGGIQAPLRPVRTTASDAALLELIRARLTPRASASRLLRQLRDEDQIACEQGRFAKLFREAQTQGHAQ